MPEVYQADIPVWDQSVGCKASAVVHFLLPHEVFETKSGDTPSLWTAVGENTSMRRLRDESAQRVGIPDDEVEDIVGVGLWGDCAPFSKADSLMLLLWNCMFYDKYARYWICVMPKHLFCRCGCLGRCTTEAILRVVSWAFGVWLSGEEPTYRHDDVPFHQSKRRGDRKRAKRARKKLKKKAIVVQSRQDWQWLKQVLGLIGWRAEGLQKRVCFRCLAGLTGLYIFTDPSMAANWRDTLLNDSEFIQDQMLRFFSVFWSIPGMTASKLVLDLMHVGCLGIVQYFLGNLFLELYFKLGGNSNETKSRQVLGEIVLMVKHCTKMAGLKKTPLNNLTLAMLRPDGKDPRLKLKAADSRHMVMVAYYLFMHIQPAQGSYETMRFHCLEALYLFYEAVKARDSLGYGKLARKHVMLYCELAKARHYVPFEYCRYRHYPKHHLFIHLAEEDPELHGCPIDSWNYTDESTIGICVKSVGDCAQNASAIQRTAIDKYRL